MSGGLKLALDKALDRRISLKVEFEPPDRPMRKQIWGRLVPKKLPVAPDVDFDKLSEPELTGGEIKNAVLNAARLALARNPDGQVTMADFRKAIEMETQGRWHDQGGGRVGFRA
jgi:ATP-dependent 26S proteasome regulatory subunit